MLGRNTGVCAFALPSLWVRFLGEEKDNTKGSQSIGALGVARRLFAIGRKLTKKDSRLFQLSNFFGIFAICFIIV